MILCIGEAVIDLFFRSTPQLGEIFFPLPGGCAYNTSIAASRLGAEAAFLGRISRSFFGDIQLKRLQENNVKDDFIIRCDENPVLAFIKTEKGKEPEYAFYDEGTADRLLSESELPCKLPADTSCIMFGSISMAMEPIATTIENFILKEAKERVIVFDPNIRPLIIKDRALYIRRFEKWAAVSSIVKISIEDFDYIMPNVNPSSALDKLTALGTRLAVITLGADGAIAQLKRDGGSAVKITIPGIKLSKAADTVGAGDTFCGALLAWLDTRGLMSHNIIAALSENDLKDALVFANRAAAFVCTRNGAEPPTVKELKDF